MKISNFKFLILNRLILSLFFGFVCYSANLSQSTEQKFPTLVESNEINGKIAARDIGDSRLTTYYYAFNGTQGDIFLTIETNNLNGDIDIFTADDLRPITKIPVFAGSAKIETVRTIYLRQNEKLILRIEGKTPNDDEATYKIKFEGSFVAITDAKNDETEMPKVKTKTDSEVVVNSVGTIIEVKPKPTETPKNEIAKKEKTKIPKVKSNAKPNKEEPKSEEIKQVTEVVAIQKPSIKPPKVRKPKNPEPEKTPATEKSNLPKTAKKNKVSKPKIEPKTNPLIALESVNLRIELKDGTIFERPMSEVVRVNVDKEGSLTVVTKEGKIIRYSILDVAKMTIQ